MDGANSRRARSTARARLVLPGRRARGADTRDGAADRGGEGHEIGSHGWSHRSLWLCGPRRTEDEIARAQHFLSDAIGAPFRHFRPPWGMLNGAMFGALRRHGQRCVLWSIQPEGLRETPPVRQVEHVLDHAHPGAIVDLHDAEGVRDAPERLLVALPAMIAGVRRLGYDLVTVGELLG